MAGQNSYVGKSPITQNVISDSNNSSTTNLSSGNSYTFTGVGSSTLGVVGLQWGLKTDQNATVYIEESDDNVNWDISYTFNYIASKGGRSETIQATLSYWRIRVVLAGTTATTYFRLSGVLCPVAVPMPSSLSADGRLKSENTLTGKENADRHVWISPTNALNTFTTTRLAGTTFDGTVKDTNFWTEKVGGSGAVSQSGEIKLYTGTTANSSASYASVRKARFVGGSANKFQGIFKLNTPAQANNTRKFGAYNGTDGFYFQLKGTDFGVASYKAGVETYVTGGFNGNMGSTFTPVSSSYYKYEIEYTPGGAFYYVNSSLLHKSVGGHLTSYLTLPIHFENINTGGNSTANLMDCLGVVISRQGEAITSSTYKYVSGSATTVCKIGAGDLHSVTNNDNAGSMVIYDGVDATGTRIAAIDLAKVLGTLTFNVPFNTGLTLVSTGAPSVTVIYE